MAASVLDIADAVVAAIEAAWGPTDPDSVERDYLFRADLDRMQGRQVRVYPLSYTDNPASRGSVDGGESICEFGIGVTVAERCTEAGKPSREWVDERVTFAEEKVYNVLSNRLPGVSKSLTLEADAGSVYDIGILGQNRAFWSEFEFVFRVLM